jgi:chromosome segregation ATPase
MAENTPNEKDIRNAQERLAEYNDSLRESISLSRVLSDNIQTFAKRLGGVNVEDRKLIDGTKEIGRALTNTLKLSDKLYAGKLKQAEIDKQLGTLARLKNEYAKEEQNENSKINQAKSLQSKLQEDVKKLEDEGIAIRARYTERLEDQLDLTQQVSQKEESIHNVEKNRIKSGREIIKLSQQEIGNLKTANSIYTTNEDVAKRIEKSQKNSLGIYDKLKDAQDDTGINVDTAGNGSANTIVMTNRESMSFLNQKKEVKTKFIEGILGLEAFAEFLRKIRLILASEKRGRLFALRQVFRLLRKRLH